MGAPLGADSMAEINLERACLEYLGLALLGFLMHFNLVTFFYEIRCVFALCVLTWSLGRVGFWNSLSKLVFVYLTEKALVLRVQLEEFCFDPWNGYLLLGNGKILLPDYNVDSRWHNEIIVDCQAVLVKFKTITLLRGILLSRGNLAIIDNIEINGLTIFVEGFQAGDGQVLNVSLIGGEVSRKIIKVEEDLSSRIIRDNNKNIFTTNNETCSPVRAQVVQAVPMMLGAATAIPVPATVINANRIIKTSTNIVQATRTQHDQNRPINVNVDASNSSFASAKCTATVTVIPSPATATSSSSSLASSKAAVSTAIATASVSSASSGGFFARLLKETVTMVSAVQEHVTTFNNQVNEKGIMEATKHTLDKVVQSAKQSLGDSVQHHIAQVHRSLRGEEPTAAQCVVVDDVRVSFVKMTVQDITIRLRRTLPIALRHLEKRPLHIACITQQGDRHGGRDDGVDHDHDDCRKSPASEQSHADKTTNNNSNNSSHSNNLGIPVEWAWLAVVQRTWHSWVCPLPAAGEMGLYAMIVQYRFERAVMSEILIDQGGRLLYDAVVMPDTNTPQVTLMRKRQQNTCNSNYSDNSNNSSCDNKNIPSNSNSNSIAMSPMNVRATRRTNAGNNQQQQDEYENNDDCDDCDCLGTAIQYDHNAIVDDEDVVLVKHPFFI